MAKYLLLLLLTLLSLTLSFMSGVVVSKLQRRPKDPTPQPPKSIVICGIADHPCIRYAVSYHEPTGKAGDRAGEGLTDYEAKTISIAYSKDSFVNVSTLVHEVYHATLSERGFTNKKVWKLHDWIYFSEGPISMVLHDNPELMRYIANGY